MQGNVEPIQNVQRLADLGGQYIQIGLPHVAADKLQSAHHPRPQGFQSLTQRGLGSSPPHPQQSATVAIDLINHRQKLICFFALTQWISSTPMDSTPWSFRCSKPQPTNHSTDR